MAYRPSEVQAIVESNSSDTSKSGRASGSFSQLSGRIPAIDGLRAFAVLGVILFHLQLRGMVLGWAGVWLFYVISGFLITGILLDAKAGSHYFRNFYARRVLRIFPIYYALLFGVFVVGALSGRFKDIGYYLIYAQNQLLASTRFEPAFPTAYNHTWTLAVEEQFYLLWPLLVRFVSTGLLTRICISLIFAAPLARAVLLNFTHNAFWALTPLICNVDALAVGGLLAIWLRGDRLGISRIAVCTKTKRRCEVLSLAILIIVFTIVLSFGHRAYWDPTLWMQRVNVNIVFNTVLALWFATLLFYVVVWDTWLRRILGHKTLVHVGRISYGIYLFHGLVITYAGTCLRALNPQWGDSKIALVLVNLSVPYLLALVSWRFFETRFLRLKREFV